MLQNEIKKYILENNLSEAVANKTVLIAYSGGTDSVSLLHACHNIGLKCAAIHLNHGWRGGESDADECFAQGFCESLKIEFYCEKCSADIKKTELAAREARYEFFERCAKKFGSDIVFLAHNKNDNIETLLYRVFKGTGIKGLGSIPHTRGIFYRPMLGILREDIERYARENSLPIAHDSSNNDTKYARNFIRKELLPKILELNPNALDAIENLIKIAASQSAIIEDTKKSVMEGNTISTQKFLALPQALQMAVLHDFLKDDLKNCSYKKIAELLEIVLENAKYPSPKKCSLNREFYLTANKTEIAKTPVL